jgi:hypothetical protein
MDPDHAPETFGPIDHLPGTLTFEDLRPEFAEEVRATARRLVEDWRGKAPG